MRCILALVALLLVLPLAAHAGGVVSSTAWSEYEGYGLQFHDGPVIQSDLTYFLPHGFYAGAWYSLGLDDTDLSSNFGDELDWFVGWAGNVEGVSVDTAVMYFDVYPIFATDGTIGDAIEVYATVKTPLWSSQKHTLTPYITVRRDEVFKSDIPDGYYTHVGVDHTWKATDKLSIAQSAEFLHDSGAYGFNEGLMGRYFLDFNWTVEEVTISAPKVKVVTPLSSGVQGRFGGVVVGAGVSYTF